MEKTLVSQAFDLLQAHQFKVLHATGVWSWVMPKPNCKRAYLATRGREEAMSQQARPTEPLR